MRRKGTWSLSFLMVCVVASLAYGKKVTVEEGVWQDGGFTADGRLCTKTWVCDPKQTEMNNYTTKIVPDTAVTKAICILKQIHEFEYVCESCNAPEPKQTCHRTFYWSD